MWGATYISYFKNAFKKHPLQNRTNVQIKGGGGQRPFEQCSKKLHFSERGASLIQTNILPLVLTPLLLFTGHEVLARACLRILWCWLKFSPFALLDLVIWSYFVMDFACFSRFEARKSATLLSSAHKSEQHLTSSFFLKILSWENFFFSLTRLKLIIFLIFFFCWRTLSLVCLWW